jgi:hypothetical protein
LLLFLCGATAVCRLAQGQESNKPYKIGILTASGSARMLEGIFRDSLRELGLIEGKNLVFEGRYAENDLDRLPALVPNWSASKWT